MLQLWRNPELIRHVRSELRRTRALAVALLVVVISLLVGLACWISEQNSLNTTRNLAAQFDGRWNAVLAEMERRMIAEFWYVFYRTLVLIQAGVLTFWSLLSCAQSVSGERERKTWDFQRITRLSAAEMLVGKVSGEPVLAYFIVLCCIPITFGVGLAAGVSIFRIFSAYALIVASAAFMGLTGIWLSCLLESRSRGIGIIGALGLYACLIGAYGFHDSDFPGLAGFSPITGLLSLFGYHSESGSVARLFGAEVSWPLMTLLVYSSFGAWFAIMALDNIKRDYEEVRPLSRWQAVACATFVNFMVCVLFYFRPQFVAIAGVVSLRTETIYIAQSFVTTLVTINAAVLFAVGLATLTPHEHLKLWWRKRMTGRASLFAEDGLPWPWLLLSALTAYAILILGLFVWRKEVSLDGQLLLMGAIQSAIVGIFVTRDVLFVQWCRLTRLRAPVIKGCLYLCLYYAASITVAALLGIRSEDQYLRTLDILTPASAFTSRSHAPLFLGSIVSGVVMQLALIAVLLRAITLRLKKTSIVQAAAMD